MDIVAVSSVPLVEHFFQDPFQLTLIEEGLLSPEDLSTADILLTRSTVKINAALLAKSHLRYVATATSGIDHIDENALKKHNTTLIHAPGSNALAVAEYVASCVAYLKPKKTAAVIGVGHVGRLVVKTLTTLGFDILQYDPPREAREADFTSANLNDCLQADLICLHTPLTHTGDHPTYHLLNAKNISRIKPGSILLNAGRGDVIDTSALNTDNVIACFDVFPHEPLIDLDLLQRLTLATPHIAGHTQQGKWRGTAMVYQALCTSLTLPITRALPADKPINITTDKQTWEEILLAIYNPFNATQHLKTQLLKAANHFYLARVEHPKRHEFSCMRITCQRPVDNKTQNILQQLGLYVENSNEQGQSDSINRHSHVS